MAIDDIIVHDGFCTATDLCTFENQNYCGYTNDPLATFSWVISNSNSSTSTTGPSVDVKIKKIFFENSE